MSSIKTSITPATAVKVLAENGMQVNEEQAKNILQFLVTLAETTINENSLPIHTR